MTLFLTMHRQPGRPAAPLPNQRRVNLALAHAHAHAWALALALAATGCASPQDRANDLLRAGRGPEAVALLEQALRAQPADAALGAALQRQRRLQAQQWLGQAEAQRSAGQLDAAQQALALASALDPTLPRTAQLARDIARSRAQANRLQQARQHLAGGQFAAAEAIAAALLADDPGQPAAAELRRQINAARPPAPPATTLGPDFLKPVPTLAFRDATLRQVFETLAAAAGISFVFDREVKADSKITLQLRDTTLDEALRIVLTVQGLERKLLNAYTLLIYPATAAKQREHQDLQTRAFYLANADVKQAQNMVRTLVKSRDVHVEERLNLLLVRDTPEVLQLVAQLVATIDLPEPEVVLDVEVLEVASDRLDSIGLQWPETVAFGALGPLGADGGATVPGVAALGERRGFRGWVANPALLATLTGSSGAGTLIANPSIRVRNREKARVLVGDKLPVFTTTSTANVGVSSSVSYLDVGLKLDIEPSVQLGNEVNLRVALEVSNLIKAISGPAGSVAYQVGTRMASTSLRLKDGETQLLAGLINDEDRKRAVGVPGLSTLPAVGALFGVQSNTRNRTEVVLLITPRVVRNLALPAPDGLVIESGNDSNPGAAPLRLRPQARGAVGLASALEGAAGATPVVAAVAAVVAVDAGAAQASAAPAGPAAAGSGERLRLSASARGRVGELVSVTLANDSALAVRGELLFDNQRLQPTAAGAGDDGRLPFNLAARGELVLVLRLLPLTRGETVLVNLQGVSAKKADGTAATLAFDGETTIEVAAE